MSSNIDPTMLVVISSVIALVITIILWFSIIPEKRREKLNKFFGYLSDVFNFRSLLIEKLLKFLYILTTIFSIIFGFCMLFVVSYGESMALYGILVMIGGPIALRIAFETCMLGILLVNNVIEMNNKLSVKTQNEEIVEENDIIVEND